MALRIEVTSEHGHSAIHECEGSRVLLGRSTRCDIRFSGDDIAEVVSWEHAELEVGDRLILRDLKSTNQTFVNELATTEQVLQVGDRISLGKSGPSLRILDFRPPEAKPVRSPGPLGFSQQPHRDRPVVVDAATSPLNLAGSPAKGVMVPADDRLAPKRGETRELAMKAFEQSQRSWATSVSIIILVSVGLITLIAFSILRARNTKSLGSGVYERLLSSTALVSAHDDTSVSQGSAVLVDARRRLLVTNFHVVGAITDVEVYVPLYDAQGQPLTNLSDYETDFLNRIGIKGKVVVIDVSRDLAVIELEALWDGAREVRLARRLPRAGDTVHSIGNPIGAAQGLWIYTSGRVRQVKQFENVDPQFGLYSANSILTDSAINHGDSGGPLVNDAGELVGVTVLTNPATGVSAFSAVDEVEQILQAANRKLKRSAIND